jgi:hypothetical protein
MSSVAVQLHGVVVIVGDINISSASVVSFNTSSFYIEGQLQAQNSSLLIQKDSSSTFVIQGDLILDSVILQIDSNGSTTPLEVRGCLNISDSTIAVSFQASELIGKESITYPVFSGTTCLSGTFSDVFISVEGDHRECINVGNPSVNYERTAISVIFSIEGVCRSHAVPHLTSSLSTLLLMELPFFLIFTTVL